MSKKINEVKKNYLLDTSIQIQACKSTEFSKYLHMIKCDGAKLSSSFFVLYEFKTGLIKTAIEFYFNVKNYNDVAKAYAKFSDAFETRQIKNVLIIQTALSSLHNSIQTSDVDSYLRQLEAVIFYFLSNFDTYLDSMAGSFENDEIVRMKIRNEKEFSRFVDAYNARKCIPMEEFWKENENALKKIINDANFKSDGGLRKMHQYLTEIDEDIRKANKFNNNKGIGDAVISVDCSSKKTILTLDHSFSLLCPPINKKCEVIKKPSL